MTTTFSPAVAKILRDYAPYAAAALGNAVLPGVGSLIGGVVGKVAAEALSEPAQVAVQEIGKKLGVDRPTIERINSVILDTIDGKPEAQRMPDLQADLMDADNRVRLRLAEMAHEEATQRLHNEDRAGARAMQSETKVLTPAVVTYILLGALISYYAAAFFISIPPDNQRLIDAGGQVLETLCTAAVFFWVGSSIGSKRNGDAVRAVATERR